MPSIPPAPQPRSFTQLASESPVTVTILAANVAAFLMAATRGHLEGQALTMETLIRFGATERSAVWSGQWWRIFTAPAMHLSFMHLAWNTAMMFGMCAAVERSFGRARFLSLYVASGVAGASASLLLHDAVSAGASGAGFGMIGVLLALRRRQFADWASYFAEPAVRSTLINLGLWTLIGLYAHMDNFAHAGGFVAGASLAWIYTARPFVPVLLAPYALALTALGGAAVHHWPGMQSIVGAYALSERGRQALVAHDPRTAVTLMTQAETLGHSSAEMYYNRAIARSDLGDHANAVADLRAAAGLAVHGSDLDVRIEALSRTEADRLHAGRAGSEALSTLEARLQSMHEGGPFPAVELLHPDWLRRDGWIVSRFVRVESNGAIGAPAQATCTAYVAAIRSPDVQNIAGVLAMFCDGALVAPANEAGTAMETWSIGSGDAPQLNRLDARFVRGVAPGTDVLWVSTLFTNSGDGGAAGWMAAELAWRITGQALFLALDVDSALMPMPVPANPSDYSSGFEADALGPAFVVRRGGAARRTYRYLAEAGAFGSHPEDANTPPAAQ